MDGTIVNHIQLPDWTKTIEFNEDDAKGNPFVYVAKTMELLESEEVRQEIQHWIDLTYGKKS